ncbi:MAG: Stk1 family PASTA domain-containing Ser/Thr kinase [Negativicutes bacterium]|nr:Stk1 family PASTA domain-containing Ser/Thr kinase [Negativicutes bacterium]
MRENHVLAGRYQLLEKIGSGGMADVFHAHDLVLKRDVAIKILKNQFTDDAQFVNRFRQEAQAAARLNHPHIVAIYDVGQQDGCYYIVMEYVAGETLKDMISRRRSLPVAEALEITLQIAQALHFAHQNGLVHCDIKPANILIDRYGRVRVADFGIARAVSSATMAHTSSIVGSVHYLSPEQARGSLVDARSDIYSLGVALYEMLSGKLPFTGDSAVAIAVKHLQEEPRPLADHVHLPQFVEAIVDRALTKDVIYRYQSVEQLTADAEKALQLLRQGKTAVGAEELPTQFISGVRHNTMVIDRRQFKSQKTAAAGVEQNGDGRRGRFRWLILAGLLLLLLAGFGTGMYLVYGNFWSARDVVVPDVVGKDATTAIAMLQSEKLNASISEQVNDKVKPGFVISQDPPAGSRVKEQRRITLYISKGAEATYVPDLRGLGKDEAVNMLTQAGLLLGRVSERESAGDKPGTVIDQSLRANSQTTKGTTVDIVISAASRMSVPDLRGLTVGDARQKLEGMKLKLGNVDEVPADSYPVGTVVTQKPLAGGEIPVGGTVDVAIARQAQPTVSRQTVVVVDVPAGGTARQTVQIVLTDNDGRRVVYDEVHKPGDHIEKTVQTAGTGKIQVFINGTLVQTQQI